MKKSIRILGKRVVSIIALLLVAAVLLWLITWAPAEQEETLKTATVSERTLERTLDTTGVVVTRAIDGDQQKVVQIFMNENDVDEIALDEEVKLSFDTIDDEINEWNGKIQSISDEPRIAGEVTDYETIITVEDMPEQIRNGMHAQVTIVLDRTEKEVLSVPTDSVYTSEGNYFVDLVTEERRVHLKRLGVDRTDQTTESLEVTLGFEGDDYTEVTEGVKEGDVVVAE